MDQPDVMAAINTLGWLELIKRIGGFMVIAGVAIEVGGDWFATPFHKKVEDARQLELTQLNNETARLTKESTDSRAEIVKASVEAERLKADNLALQKLMLPRRLPPPIVLSAGPPTTPPPGFELYDHLARFNGTPFFIQSVPDFEAMKLAQDIAAALANAGWQPQTPAAPQVPPNLIYDGVIVTTPLVGSSQDRRVTEAAAVLANGLLSLGIKGPPGFPDNFSPGYRLKSDGTSVMRGYPTFDPPREVVVILVGMRPIPASALAPPK